MGDTRRRGDIWEHQVAAPGQPEQWDAIGYDSANKPVTLIQADRATVSLTPDGAFLAFDFGGHIVTAPATVAAALADALSTHVPAAAQTAVAAQVAQIQAQIDAKKAEHAAVIGELDTELQAKQAEVASATEALVAAQRTLAHVEAQTAAAAAPAVPGAPAGGS